MIKTGIDAIAFYTSPFYLDLHTLAEKRNTEYEKFKEGIGIEKIGIPAPDEDIITMAANAAATVLADSDPDSVGTLLFATESGIDQSKSAAVFVHDLLGLSHHCRVAELKQACYASTAALQAACAIAARNPEKSVLVISADIARYELNTPGEATQGCGAVAMIVKADPRLMVIDEKSGCYCASTWDFWRPNYCSNPLLDGKFSMINYVKTAKESWKELESVSGIKFDEVDAFCYHLPFSSMGLKAHTKLAKETGSAKSREELEKQLEPTLRYCRQIGNCYSASAYFSLCSLLDNSEKDLTDRKIAVFSYGSGCAGEFFTATPVKGYKERLYTSLHQSMLASRKEIDFETYLEYYKAGDILAETSGNISCPAVTTGNFRFSGIKNHCRMYEKCLQITE